MCLVTLKFGRAWAFAKTNVDESISTFRYGIFQEHTFCFSDTLGVSGGRHRAADLEFETLFEDRLDHNLAGLPNARGILLSRPENGTFSRKPSSRLFRMARSPFASIDGTTFFFLTSTTLHS